MADEKRNMNEVPMKRDENEIERVKREGAEAAGVGREVQQGAGNVKSPQQYEAENVDKAAERPQAKAENKVEAKGDMGKDAQGDKATYGKGEVKSDKADADKKQAAPPIIGRPGQQPSQGKSQGR